MVYRIIFQGDGGGPMNFQNADGTWTAIGIASYIGGCTLRSPSVYTWISFYRDWIDSYVNINKNKLSTTTATTTSVQP